MDAPRIEEVVAELRKYPDAEGILIEAGEILFALLEAVKDKEKTQQ
ncbi:hypothetical protein [Terasakiella sp. SH-1]|nr:hypothetical protein [Terasakiella sp. SH-1]